MRTAIVRLLVVVALAATAVATVAPAGAAAPVVGVQSESFTIGPFDLAPQGEPGDQVNRLFEDAPRPAGEIAVHSIEWALVDDSGTALTDDVSHLHHIVLLDSTRPDHLCSFPGSSRFSGTGKELTDFVLPDGYAYHSGDGPWSSVYHVMNLSDAPITAAIEYTVTWTDAAETDLIDVEPYFLDVTGCWGNSEYHVPGDGGADSIHEQDRTYVIDRDGIAVVGGGHIHAGGIDLVLTHEGEEICRSEAVYHEGAHGGHHALKTVTPCGQIDHPWAQGDEINLLARYRNDQPTPGAMGIMVMYVQHTGPPPPPPTIDILDIDLEGSALVGTLLCNQPMAVYLDATISQDKAGPPISASSYSEPVDCADEPSMFTMPLMYANGALTGGAASYRVFGYGSTPRASVSAEVVGELHVRGRVEPQLPAPPPGGPVAIAIDEHPTTRDRVVTGTLTCDEPTLVYLSAQARQTVGRHLLEGYGSSAELPCDGTAPFELQMFTSGRFAAGPADVRVSAYSFSGDFGELSVQLGTVHFPAPADPGIDGYGLPDPDPADPLQITSSQRNDDGVHVALEYADCPDGASYYLNVQAIEDRSGKGHRLPPESTYGFDYGVCDGSAAFTAQLAGIDARRVTVWASIDWYLADGHYGGSSNTARLTLRR